MGGSTSAFGQAAGAGGNQGTAVADFAPTQDRDVASGTNNFFQTITAMPQYKNYSVEELRLQDYSQNRKTAGAAGAATTGFGTPAAGGSAFGSTSTGGFGQPSTTAFGQQSTTTSAFGQPQASTGFGASNTGTGLFGQPASSGTSAFGSTTGTTGFGSTGSTGFGSGTGGFGASAAPKPLFGMYIEIHAKC